VNGAAQIPDAFPMHNAHVENAADPASLEIIGNQFFDFLRAEAVQVEHAIDWQFDWALSERRQVVRCRIHGLRETYRVPGQRSSSGRTPGTLAL
jgi:hypothetical protein